MSTNAKKFLYFYSTRCKFCGQFSEMLERSKIKNNFIPISIDNPAIKLPPYLEAVPTIQVYDDGGRRHILTDKHAFEWLNQYAQKPIETEAYCLGEMGSSISDCFSFINDKENESLISNNKDYASLQQLEDFFITTPAEGSDVATAQKQQASRMGGGGSGSGGNVNGNSFFGNGGNGGNGGKADVLSAEMEKLKAQRAKDTPIRGPPPNVPDFSNGNNSEANDQAKQAILQRKYDLIMQQRNSDIPKRRVPSIAPNFESPNYKSQFVSQDMIKDMYQKKPQQRMPHQNIDYQHQIRGVVPNVPRPSANPNFKVSPYFDNRIKRI